VALPNKLNRDYFHDNLDYNKLKFDLLENSYKWNIAHIPSALSMLKYLSYMITLMKFKYPEYQWVAGKQFGQQAYYTIYQKIGLEKLIPNTIQPLLLNGINKEFAYVEETLGNSLGVAIGMAMSQGRPIWINLSDSVFQMGRVQEALRMISQLNLNILITIDGNRSSRCTSSQASWEVYKQEPAKFIRELMEANGFEFDRLPGYGHRHTPSTITIIDKILTSTKPRCIYFDTTKGNGFDLFEKESVTWHYKKMDSNEFTDIIREQIVRDSIDTIEDL
jgi:hypothetical protein